jgi:hypothetical protein
MAYGAYALTPTLYPKLFKSSDAPPGKEYREALTAGLGQFRTLQDGQPVTFDAPVEVTEKAETYTEFGLATGVSKNMREDELFGVTAKSATQLGEGGAWKIELEAWDVMNDAFVGTRHTAIDSLPICSVSHAIGKTGALQPNAAASGGSLSETTFQAAQEYFFNLKNHEGRPIYGRVTPNMLIIPYKLHWMANKLLKTEAVVDAMDNSINTANPKNGVVNPWTILMVPYLTSTTAWWLVDSAKFDTRIFFKRKYTMEVADDPSTRMRLYLATLRFRAFVMDWIPGWGNVGA